MKMRTSRQGQATILHGGAIVLTAYKELGITARLRGRGRSIKAIKLSERHDQR